MGHLTRRTFVGSVASLAQRRRCRRFGQSAAPAAILKKAIPSTGEQIPAIGLGTWITFNVGSDEKLRAARAQVMQTFFDRGGTPDRFFADVWLFRSGDRLRPRPHRRTRLRFSPPARCGPCSSRSASTRWRIRASSGVWSVSISCRSTTSSIGAPTSRR